MPKSDTWPGGVSTESVSGMDSAGSYDSVLSNNSGFVSMTPFIHFPEHYTNTDPSSCDYKPAIAVIFCMEHEEIFKKITKTAHSDPIC